MKFTQSQLDAIRHGDTNLQLIACAGSGKTEVVARRVANLIKTGLKPRNIIAFTFTDKAAAELKDRIVTRCREAIGEVYGLAEMYVGTIHGFCLDLLMTEVHDALKFNVLNEVQQTLFIDRHSKASGLTTCTDLNGVPLRRYRDTNHYLSALNILREDEPNAKALAGSSLPGALDTYQALLDDRRYFDYSEILSRAVVELKACKATASLLLPTKSRTSGSAYFPTPTKVERKAICLQMVHTIAENSKNSAQQRWVQRWLQNSQARRSGVAPRDIWICTDTWGPGGPEWQSRVTPSRKLGSYPETEFWETQTASLQCSPRSIMFDI
jgi:hypothetical protein